MPSMAGRFPTPSPRTVIYVSILILTLTSLASGRPLSDAVCEAPTFTNIYRRSTPDHQKEIECYKLPYGVPGVISHLLTYWQVFWLSRGKLPLKPWKDVCTSPFNVLVNGASLIISVPVSAVTITRSNSYLFYELIAIWATMLAFTHGAVVVHSVIQSVNDWLKDNDEEGFKKKVCLWLLPYAIFDILGLAGLFTLEDSVIKHGPNADNARIVAGSFGGAYAFAAVLTGLLKYMYPRLIFGRILGHIRDDEWPRFIRILMASVFGVCCGVVCMVILSVFNSDVALAAITNNWGGAPTGDRQYLVWIFFVAQRLPMLCGLFGI